MAQNKLSSPKVCTTFACLLLSVAFSAGCSKSGSPSIGELVVTRPPTFGGLLDHNYVTPVTTFSLAGECDPISYGLQYSYNNSSWTDIPGGCPANGHFTLNFLVTPRKDVWARAVTKNGTSSSAHANVRLLLPPTSPAFSVAQSAGAEEDGNGNQSVMGINFDNKPMSSVFNKLYTDIVGIVYDSP